MQICCVHGSVGRGDLDPKFRCFFGSESGCLSLFLTQKSEEKHATRIASSYHHHPPSSSAKKLARWLEWVSGLRRFLLSRLEFGCV